MLHLGPTNERRSTDPFQGSREGVAKNTRAAPPAPLASADWGSSDQAAPAELLEYSSPRPRGCPKPDPSIAARWSGPKPEHRFPSQPAGSAVFGLSASLIRIDDGAIKIGQLLAVDGQEGHECQTGQHHQRRNARPTDMATTAPLWRDQEKRERDHSDADRLWQCA